MRTYCFLLLYSLNQVYIIIYISTLVCSIDVSSLINKRSLRSQLFIIKQLGHRHGNNGWK